MANIIKRVWNQNRMVQIEDLKGMTFQAEQAGHTFQISGIDDDGNTVALTGTPAGVLLRPDNTDVALTCSVSGGVVSATLPANCYDVPGRFGLTIFITSGSSKTAIYAAVGTVTRTSSGTVAPGTSQSVVDLINAINAAVNSIPASYSALLADIAPTYSDSALYSVGQYAWYDGDLKRCIVPITTAESYTAAHWTSAVFGQDVSDLKSAFTKMTGNEKITFVEDFFINTSGATVDIAHPTYMDSYAYAVVDCVEGDAFTISGSGGGSPRLWCFIDSSGNSLAVSDISATASNLVLIAPKNAAKLIINDNSGSESFRGVQNVYYLNSSQKLKLFKYSYGGAPTDQFIDLSIQNRVTGKAYWLQIVYTSNSTQQFTVYRTNEGSPRSYDKYKQLKSPSVIHTGIQRYTETMPDGEIFSVVIDWDKTSIPFSYSYYPDLYVYNDAVFSGGLLTAFITQNLSAPNIEPVAFIYDKLLIWYATESGHTGGSTAGSGGYKCSKYIDASTVTEIKGLIFGGGGTVANIAYYNEDKTYISGIANTTGSSYFVSLTASNFPANTAFIRICTYYTSEIVGNIDLNIIRGKSTITEINQGLSALSENVSLPKPLEKYWAACGDSITNANHGNIYDIEPDDPYLPIDGYSDLNTYKRMNYAYYISKKNRIQWANYGYGGTVLHHCAPKAYSNINLYPFVDTRIENLKAGIDWDYITIFFGWNDCSYGPIYQRDLWLQETYQQDIGYPVQVSQVGTTGFATAEQKAACDAATGTVGGVEYTDTTAYFIARFIGTIDDNVKTTWYGAWNYALSYLMKKYIKAKIMIVCPYLRPNQGLNGVREAVRNIANKWGVACFDFEDVPYWYCKNEPKTTPLAPASGNWKTENNDTCANTVEGYNMARFSYDTLHPSNLGYITLADPFGAKLFNT